MSASEWILGISAMAIVGIAGWALVTLIANKTDVLAVKRTIERVEREIIAVRAIHSSSMERIDQRFEWGASSINKIKIAIAQHKAAITMLLGRIKALETKKGKS